MVRQYLANKQTARYTAKYLSKVPKQAPDWPPSQHQIISSLPFDCFGAEANVLFISPNCRIVGVERSLTGFRGIIFSSESRGSGES